MKNMHLRDEKELIEMASGLTRLTRTLNDIENRAARSGTFDMVNELRPTLLTMQEVITLEMGKRQWVSVAQTVDCGYPVEDATQKDLPTPPTLEQVEARGKGVKTI